MTQIPSIAERHGTPLWLWLTGALALLVLVSTNGTRQQPAAALMASNVTANPAAAAAPPKPPRIPKKELPPKCLYLERVCFDQQQVIMMDPLFRPQHRRQEPLPEQPDSHQQFVFPTDASTNSDVWGVVGELPQLTMRHAGVLEPSADLRQPRFRTDVLPLVLKPAFVNNFSHTLGNSVAWLYAYLHASNVSWAKRVALVVQTPYGMALPAHWPKLAGPLVPARPIQTLADFSARSAGGSNGGSSSEAGDESQPGRCYAQALICPGMEQKGTHSINITQGAAFLVRHYAATPVPPNVTYQGGGAGCRRNSNGSSTSGRGGSSSSSTRCLRVLFMSRNSKPAVRQILNLGELVQQCTEWDYRDNSTGILYRAACAAYRPTGDLRQDIAAVQSADVIVGTHGASIANGFFLRPGGAIFEFFNRGYSWHLHRFWMDEDPTAQLQWWGMTVQDPGMLSPGEMEQQNKKHPNLYSGWWGDFLRLRDFNVQVPWAGVALLLQQYAATQLAGGMEAYRRRRQDEKNPVHYLIKPGGTIEPDFAGPDMVPF